VGYARLPGNRYVDIIDWDAQHTSHMKEVFRFPIKMYYSDSGSRNSIPPPPPGGAFGRVSFGESSRKRTDFSKLGKFNTCTRLNKEDNIILT